MLLCFIYTHTHFHILILCRAPETKFRSVIICCTMNDNKSKSNGAFRPNVTKENTIASDASFAPLDHFASFASFALARSFLNLYISTRSLSTSIMIDITTFAALYLLYKSQKRRKTTHHRIWIHEVLRRCKKQGEFHCLLQKLRLDDDRFQWYLRLTGVQFDDLLARVGARISRLDTNYRCSISAAERPSICLR